MARDDSLEGEDRTVIDWRPVNGPLDAGLRPAQVVARRERLVAAETGDSGALLSADARMEWTGLRLRHPAAETDPGGLPLVVMALWCRVLAGEQTDFERFRREESLTRAQRLLERVRREAGGGGPHTFAASVELVQVLAVHFDHTGEALALERAAVVLADLERGSSPPDRAAVTELGCLVPPVAVRAAR
ncbi:hypothetical protein [Streptomyces goshikiensis]|uniref:hypothetical protein n=1 Tax=Streptomyces goshikiensis TaxID=1942 RepID=UPI0036DBA6F5